MTEKQKQEGWLLLIHQLPPKPAYLRVKIWRRLQHLGAVAIKNSVYALPKTDQAQEDFQWVLREVIEGGGDGTLCEARLVDGLTDDQVEELFHAARTADYRQIADEARRLARSLSAKSKAKQQLRPQVEGEITRLKKRLDEIVAIDFFGAPGREAASGLVSGLEARVRGSKTPSRPFDNKRAIMENLQGKTWVTRQAIHVDRMATAWLIRRFIDPRAQFKFVPVKGYRPLTDELRFDMFQAEFTHEGDRCSMEVLLARTGIRDPALLRISEIVHDIDLKDSKFEWEETSGIARLVEGIVMSHKDDEARLARASAMFDDLYENFRRKRRS
jgi:hypothetical protein